MTKYHAAVQRLANFVMLANSGLATASNRAQAMRDVAYLRDAIPTDGTWLRSMVDSDAGPGPEAEYRDLMDNLFNEDR